MRTALSLPTRRPRAGSVARPIRPPELVRKALLSRAGTVALSRKTIGARRCRFVLERPQETPDGFGGVIRRYEAGPELWGTMEMVRGSERQRADRPEQAVTYRITLPFREGVTGAMRLALGLRRFSILSACDPDGRRFDLVCIAEESGP